MTPKKPSADLLFRVRHYVEQAWGGHKTAADVSEALGVDASDARVALIELWERGNVARDDKHIEEFYAWPIEAGPGLHKDWRKP